MEAGFQEDKLQCARIYQQVMFADGSLAKTNHLGQQAINVGGKSVRM